MRIQEYIALSELTTFQIGGVARYFVEVRTLDDVREALAWAHAQDVPYTILSGGSNVLVSDEGFEGLVIHSVGDVVRWEETACTVDAGTNLLQLIQDAGNRGCGGWEKLAGIPGTVGGAVRGNAGAFGSEIKDFVVSVTALHADTGEVRTFQNEDCAFAYRDSFFKQNPAWIILSTSVYFVAGDTATIHEGIAETIAEREKRHLQNVRAAGSYFMNPVAPQEVQELFEQEKGAPAREGRVPAGWLIEKVGMKGFRIGDAMASQQHPNYLVNVGSATAEDVRALAVRIKDAVKVQFDIELKEEAAQL